MATSTAARAAAAEPAECIVVEDAAAGISSALDGGFVTVGIGSYESLKHAHRYVRSLEELSAAALRDLQQRWRCDLWTMATEISGELANRQMGLSADAGSPNLQVEWTIEGERLDLAAGTLRHAETRLDLRTRLATTTARWTSPGGREMILTHRRFRDGEGASRRFHQYELEPLSFSGEVTVAARIRAEKGSGTFSLISRPRSRTDVPGRMVNRKRVQTPFPLSDRTAALLAPDPLGVRAIGLRLLDRPHAEYEMPARDDGVSVTTRASVDQDALLYVDVVEFRRPGADANALETGRGAVAAALEQGFADARIHAAARAAPEP
ncbi:MAG TPA: hypothetical protein VMZ50_13340 [Phycisphaerae bacterium]|nr:hypothetical protein [Phycisphaerae bacterium]